MSDNFSTSYKLIVSLVTSNSILFLVLQGMIDGSASKPALRQDTGFMVEKTYHDIAPYLGDFGVYLIK